MAQTTGAMNTVGGKLELSTDGVPTYTDISGFLNMVDPGQGVRQVGSIFTAAGDRPILGGGKRELLEILFNIVYTEGGSDPFTVLLAVFEAGDEDIQLRWSPAGGAMGDYQYETDEGIIKNFSYPNIDPGTPAPHIVSFTLVTPQYTQSAVA